MVLSVDTTRPLRTPAQLVDLVSAVHKAAKEDESRAIEWKSGYPDIGSSEASFALARAILGLANRPVAVAAASFGGLGYVLVGVEPGAAAGQEVPDSAELFNAVRRYTGHGWPYWDARTVVFNDVDVLVITVEPPRAGDRIALLQKAYQPQNRALVPEGTIFVRQPGATERASRQEIEMLQDRLLSGSEAEAASSREAAKRRELRSVVTSIVHACQGWASTMEVLILMTAGGKWQQRDWVEWVNTDSGREMKANAESVHRGVRELRLSSRDQSLLDPATEVERRMRNGDVFDVIHAGGSTGEARTQAYRELNDIRAAASRLEHAGATLLAE